jgi:hypothetical protein
VNQARPVMAAQNQHLAVTEEERPRAAIKRLVELSRVTTTRARPFLEPMAGAGGLRGLVREPGERRMRPSRYIAVRAILRMPASSPESGSDPPRRRNRTSSDVAVPIRGNALELTRCLRHECSCRVA